MSNNNTTRFSDRVDNYIKYRPGYPAEMISYIELEILPKNLTGINVADVGSGTGILTKSLLEMGLNVYAVEPNAEMKNAADKIFSECENYYSHPGTAENTGLPQNSVDLIFSAQAFHWFDVDKAKSEFRRILKSENDEVILIWNKRLTSGTEFLTKYELLLKKYSTDYNKVNHVNIERKGFKEFYGKDGYKKVVFKNVQSFDREGFMGRVFSSSYVPLEGKENEIIKNSLNKLFDEFNINGKVEFVYSSVLYRGKLF